MLAARTATEIAPGQQDARAGVLGPVQLELGIVRAVVQEPPIEKQKLPKTRPLDPLEELLGDDLVRIDVRPVHRRDQSGVFCKGLHGFSQRDKDYRDVPPDQQVHCLYGE